MPEFKIRSWTHEKHTFESSSFTTGGEVMPVMNGTSNLVVETVTAVFDILDSEPVRKYGNSKMAQLPSSVHITMASNDGGEWRKRKSYSTAFNIKGDGSTGAQNDLDEIHFPEWLKAFAGRWSFSELEQCGVGDWINEEYPR